MLLTFMVINAMVSGDVNDNRLFWVTIAMAIVSAGLARQASLLPETPVFPTGVKVAA